MNVDTELSKEIFDTVNRIITESKSESNVNASIYSKVDTYFDSLRNSSRHRIDEDKLLRSNKFFTDSELNMWRNLCDVAYRGPFECNCLILESTYGKILYLNPILIHALTGEKLLEEYIKGHFRITKFNLDEHN